ncbi:MAG TPA: RICIN domain-containing protein [Candidatus Acidoferrales bacterium]|nr:RICIN domain-containing protein [Candidatus Acidoferrales bacterium]
MEQNFESTPPPSFSTPHSNDHSYEPIKSIGPKKSLFTKLSMLGGVVLLITLFVTVNGALQQHNAASHASYSGIVSGNVYRFLNKCSGQTLDVSDNSMKDGAPIIQWPWTDNGWNKDRRWEITQLSDGNYTIRPMSSFMYLSLEKNVPQQGIPIIQRNLTSPSLSEEWEIVPSSNGNNTYTVINKKSGMAIGITSCTQGRGAPIEQWQDDGSSRLRWVIEQKEGTPSPSQTTAETPTPTCTPRPACKPGFCTLPVAPLGGWCSSQPLPQITVQPTAQTKYWVIEQNAATALNATPVGSHFIQSINTPKTYEVIIKGQSGVDPLPNATHVESFQSYQEIMNAFAQNQIPANIKVILYDNENWAGTPPDEQQHPFTYVPQAEQLVHQHGLLFMNSPAADLSNVLEPSAPDKYTGYLQAQIASLAQYSDIFDIHAENAPSSAEYYQFAQQVIFLARSANNKAIILLEIRAKTNGLTSQDLIDEINRTFSTTDGYWFEISPDSSGNLTTSVNIAVPVIQSMSTY